MWCEGICPASQEGGTKSRWKGLGAPLCLLCGHSRGSDSLQTEVHPMGPGLPVLFTTVLAGAEMMVRGGVTALPRTGPL